MKFRFSPAVLTVRPGDKITWTNRDIVPHTATSVDGSWDTGHLDKDASHTIEVAEGMNARYFCRYHPSMKARLDLI